MPSSRNRLLLGLFLSILTVPAFAQKEIVIRRTPGVGPHERMKDRPMETERVAYLGVETSSVNRTVSAQLGLPKDTGLVVVGVMDQSPASGLLQEDDVLTKLDDQVLVDTHQFSVLIRGKKEGDEVRLTLFRGGKEMMVKAKLAMREMPKLAGAMSFPGGGFEWHGAGAPDGAAGLARLRQLPGMGPDEARDVLRMIQHERGQMLTGSGVHIIRRAGQGATILDLPKSNISYSDDDGVIEIKAEDGRRNLTAKNPKGDVTFEGPINSPEERAKLPPAVLKRLERIETDSISVDVDGDFKSEAVPLPPAATKTKISVDLGQAPAPARTEGSF